MTEIDPNTIITVLLGAGGVSFIGAIFKVVKDLRSGARARDRDTVGSLRTQRDEAEHRGRVNRADADFWHRLCGRLIFQMEAAGITPDTGPDGLVPPSQRQPEPVAPPARTRRGRTS